MLMLGARLELSTVNDRIIGEQTSITPLQKSESDAQTVNVKDAETLGCPLKSQSQSQIQNQNP